MANRNEDYEGLIPSAAALVAAIGRMSKSTVDLDDIFGSLGDIVADTIGVFAKLHNPILAVSGLFEASTDIINTFNRTIKQGVVILAEIGRFSAGGIKATLTESFGDLRRNRAISSAIQRDMIEFAQSHTKMKDAFSSTVAGLNSVLLRVASVLADFGGKIGGIIDSMIPAINKWAKDILGVNLGLKTNKQIMDENRRAVLRDFNEMNRVFGLPGKEGNQDGQRFRPRKKLRLRQGAELVAKDILVKRRGIEQRRKFEEDQFQREEKKLRNRLFMAEDAIRMARQGGMEPEPEDIKAAEEIKKQLQRLERTRQGRREGWMLQEERLQELWKKLKPVIPDFGPVNAERKAMTRQQQIKMELEDRPKQIEALRRELRQAQTRFRGFMDPKLAEIEEIRRRQEMDKKLGIPERRGDTNRLRELQRIRDLNENRERVYEGQIRRAIEMIEKRINALRDEVGKLSSIGIKVRGPVRTAPMFAAGFGMALGIMARRDT